MIRRGLAFAAALLALAGTALAGDFWTGTWVGGYENGDGVQLIMVGDDAIGLNWHGDYVDGLAATVSPDEKVLTLTWSGAKAVVTSGAEDGKAAMVITEPGKPDLTIQLDRETE